ncbi:MAG: metal-dependent phosphohydrolase [Blastopirellula sp.]|nr:MAG: metal-dependent phosphohydrolase [Blastopirellula sp.]
MPSKPKSRKRSEHVASLVLPPGMLQRWVFRLSNPKNQMRLMIAVFAGLVLWLFTAGWSLPFAYREGQAPLRDIHPRVQFKVLDDSQTLLAKRRAISEAKAVYENDPEPLEQMRARLQSSIVQIVSSKTYDKEIEALWSEFIPSADDANQELDPVEVEAEYTKLRELFLKKEQLPDSEKSIQISDFEKSIQTAMTGFDRLGLLTEKLKDANQANIIVYNKADASTRQNVLISDVFGAQAREKLGKSLDLELNTLVTQGDKKFLIERIKYWVSNHLPPVGTLTLNAEETEKERLAAEAAAEPVYYVYTASDVLAKSEVPLTPDVLELLHLEHNAFLGGRSLTSFASRSVAVLGMYLALGILCGVYLIYKCPQVFKSLKKYFLFVIPVVLAIVTCYWLKDQWQAEMIPIMLVGMIFSIVYRQELALLVTACVTLAVVLSIGADIATFVTITAATSVSILMTDRIRSRSKLIYIGLWAAVVAFFTNLGVNLVLGQPFLNFQSDAPFALLEIAAWQALWAVVTGFLMTGILPFVEKAFEVLTDISLLELGDAAHPLLQELVRRAPGTYNHSITVASIAEAAAESIGANGLLVRVGAYFHDIGKMMKPEYFAENQQKETGGNRHDGLLPAMSTLVIIAHVKDGADLARQNRLPQAMIDFIEQHHGTTLVEYFYQEANRLVEENPDEEAVDESNYRYPGPKPKSKEAGVLMISDVVESACRTLVEPTPARIESIVEELTMKRLLDGQFDKSGLTLSELRTIQDSVIKSLTAVYHGRVKYPNQQTA